MTSMNDIRLDFINIKVKTNMIRLSIRSRLDYRIILTRAIAMISRGLVAKFARPLCNYFTLKYNSNNHIKIVSTKMVSKSCRVAILSVLPLKGTMLNIKNLFNQKNNFYYGRPGTFQLSCYTAH